MHSQTLRVSLQTPILSSGTGIACILADMTRNDKQMQQKQPRSAILVLRPYVERSSFRIIIIIIIIIVVVSACRGITTGEMFEYRSE